MSAKPSMPAMLGANGVIVGPVDGPTARAMSILDLNIGLHELTLEPLWNLLNAPQSRRLEAEMKSGHDLKGLFGTAGWNRTTDLLIHSQLLRLLHLRDHCEATCL